MRDLLAPLGSAGHGAFRLDLGVAERALAFVEGALGLDLLVPAFGELLDDVGRPRR